MRPIRAVYESGVFKPKEPVPLLKPCEVVVELSEPEPESDTNPNIFEREIA